MRHVLDLAKATRHELGLSVSRFQSGDLGDEPEPAPRFIRELRSFQTRDLRKLLALPNGANFSVPGAGKTSVALRVYESERQRGRVDRMLVIAPLSAFEAWEEEITLSLAPPPTVYRYAGGHIPHAAEIVLANYQRLAASYGYLSQWVREHRVLVLLDEAHRMKRGWAGEWGTACLSLAYLAARRDILTGTPAPQSPADLVALVDFLWPNEAIGLLPADAVGPNPPNDAGARVASALRPLFTRTTKADLQLPPVRKSSLVIPLEDLHAHIYQALCDRYRGALAVSRRERLDLVAMGRVTMYLLEAATNPKLLAAGSLGGADADVFRHPPLDVPIGSHLADLIESYNAYETPRKFVELLRIIKRNADAGRKTLVWSNFVRNLLTLDRMLSRYQPALAYGGLPMTGRESGDRNRESEVGRFRDDPDCLVLLANPAAMSEGISLHKHCHDAIYLDRTFNAGQYLQSIDRIHRLGLDPEEETRITFLLSQDTIDEVVDRRVRVKAERLGEMLEDPNLAAVALPNDEDYGEVIDSVEDVAALFAHLRLPNET
ncbi:MAG: DEAD/DEAH box helicase [Candidatus Dormiibacterota bacterium]